MSTNDKIIAAIGYGIVALSLAFAYTYFATSERLVSVTLSIGLVAWALGWKLLPGKLKGLDRALRAMIIVIAIISAVYFYHQYPLLVRQRAGLNNTVDFLLAGLVLLITLVGAWRTSGLFIPAAVLVAILYGIFGNSLPGILFHGGLGWKRILQVEVLEMGGIFGDFTQLALTMVFIFVIFSSLVAAFGGFDWLMGLMARIIGRMKSRYGLSQVTIVGSMVFGMFSGSAAANAAGIGSMTIPLMKRYGMTAESAGAVESAASTGGQIMPPVMGLAAFIMAEWLGMSYFEVATRALPSALMFYAAVGFGTYLITRRDLQGRTGSADIVAEELKKPFSYVLGIPMGASLVVLLFAMGYLQWNVLTAGLLMVFAFLIIQMAIELSLGRKNIRRTLVQYGKNLTNGMNGGGRQAAWLVLMLAAMNAITAVLMQTGLAQRLSFQMVDLSGNNLVLLLLLIGVVAVLFGLAISTTATYIMTVVLAAPAVAQFGVPLIVTHFMVFYLAVVGVLTPPSASAVAVAAVLAKAKFWKVVDRSCRLALPLFLLPFVFIYNQDLVAAGPAAMTPFFINMVPTLALAYVLNGEIRGPIGYGRAAAYAVLSFLVYFNQVTAVRLVCLAAILLLAAAQLLPALIRRRNHVTSP